MNNSTPVEAGDIHCSWSVELPLSEGCSAGNLQDHLQLQGAGDPLGGGGLSCAVLDITPKLG